MKYILALDQGTTSSKAVIFDHTEAIVSSAQRGFTQYYPKPVSLAARRPSISPGRASG